MALKIPSFPAGLKVPSSFFTNNGAASYQEGTWTPVLTGITLSPGTGSVVTTGSYTKIGRMVHMTVTFTLTGNAKVSGTYSSGISNLPYASALPAFGDTSFVGNGLPLGYCRLAAGSSNLILVAQDGLIFDGSVGMDGSIYPGNPALAWSALKTFTANIWFRI